MELPEQVESVEPAEPLRFYKKANLVTSLVRGRLIYSLVTSLVRGFIIVLVSVVCKADIQRLPRG